MLKIDISECRQYGRMPLASCVLFPGVTLALQVPALKHPSRLSMRGVQMSGTLSSQVSLFCGSLDKPLAPGSRKASARFTQYG